MTNLGSITLSAMPQPVSGKRRFVVVVDMQGDFVWPSGALPVAGAEAIVSPMQDWLSALDPATTAGVLLTFDTHVSDVYAGSPESGQFPIHCLHGTAGWESVLPSPRQSPSTRWRRACSTCGQSPAWNSARSMHAGTTKGLQPAGTPFSQGWPPKA